MIDSKCFSCNIVLEHEPRRKCIKCPECGVVVRYASQLTEVQLIELASKLVNTYDFPGNVANKLGFEGVYYAHLIDDLRDFGLETKFTGTTHVWRYTPTTEKPVREKLKDIIDNLDSACII